MQVFPVVGVGEAQGAGDGNHPFEAGVDGADHAFGMRLVDGRLHEFGVGGHRNGVDVLLDALGQEILPWFGDVVVYPVLALGFGVPSGKFLGVGVLPATDQGLAAFAFLGDARCVCLVAGFRYIARDGAFDGAGCAVEMRGRRTCGKTWL